MDSAHDDLARMASWWPGTDVSVVRRYRQGSRVVKVFVGYFERQSSGRELASSGNADLHRVAQPIMLESGNGPFPVNVAHVTGRKPFDAIFWYEVGGTAALSPVRVKLLTARNHLLQGRSDGGVVMLLDDGPDGTGGGMSALRDLAGRLREALRGCFPPAGRPASWEAPPRTSSVSN
jgi:EpsI family protein